MFPYTLRFSCINRPTRQSSSPPSVAAYRQTVIRNRLNPDQEMIEENKSIAIGLALGVTFGVALGNIAIGIALGVVLGVVYDRKQKQNPEE